MLYAEVEGQGPRLVLVHGFTQTSHSWGEVAASLAIEHEVVRVDAPGHGRSGPARPMPAAAEQVAEAGGTAVYLGYSMGARLCLHLALAEPQLVSALVLVGGTAGIADPDERQRRQVADQALADHLERVGLEAFLYQWLANPMFAGLDPTAAGLPARLENTTQGLAASLRLAGTGAQESLWERLPELAMPVLVVAGECDAKVPVSRAMADAIGDNAVLAIISRAGHAAHLEDPTGFVGAVRPFLHGGPAPDAEPTECLMSPITRRPGPRQSPTGAGRYPPAPR